MLVVVGDGVTGQVVQGAISLQVWRPLGRLGLGALLPHGLAMQAPPARGSQALRPLACAAQRPWRRLKSFYNVALEVQVPLPSHSMVKRSATSSGRG